jgi:restriction system protein
MENNSYKSYKNYNRYKKSEEKGGYRALAFFQQAEIIYDFTVEFCRRFISSPRQKDQMEQAARSGKQNIAEGYLQKSLESRIKLLGVARGSLEELLNDYLDFLRQRGLPIWEKTSPLAQAVRKIAYNRDKNYNHYKIYLSSPEKAANAMVCLINQTNQLLDQKLRWTEEKFVKEGGFRENLFKKRLAFRQKK